ncbi:MAG: hypothetical protein AAF724_06365 [Pseudomonadota bacterium]
MLTDEALVARDLGRYLFVLVKYLGFAGFETFLWGDRQTRSKIEAGKWAGRLLDQSDVRLMDLAGNTVQSEFGPKDIVIYSSGGDQIGPFQGLKQIELVKGRKLTLQPSSYDVLFPYMLHPKYYADGRHLKTASWRRGRRNIGLFFSGNYDERYRNPDILSKFGKLQRTAILERLLESLPKPSVFRASADFSSELAATRLEDRFVFVDNLAGFRVEKSRWLETLAHCRFFLACPGVDMPLSHNLVEAMSVGCIPLTQNGDYFDPPLRDGYECVAHEGVDVVDRAESALIMGEEKIAAMRRHVIDYYERYLSADAFRRRALECSDQKIRLGLNFMPKEGLF